MYKSRLLRKISGQICICFAILFALTAQSAQAMPVDFYGKDFLVQHPLIYSFLHPHIELSLRWVITYKFEFALAIFVVLAIILINLLYVDWQIRKMVTQRFLMPTVLSATSPSRIEFPTQKVFIIGLLFIICLTLFYAHMLFTYQFYADQRYVQMLSAVFFVFVLYGGYLFGNLKRSKQLEKLINKLHLQNIDKKIAQEKLQKSEQRLQKQNASLAHSATMQLASKQDPEAVFKEIAQVSANALDVERVSVWRFDDDFKQLECIGLYIKSKDLHTASKPLLVADLPVYFQSLKQSRVISINDVHHHPATAEFTKDYLQDSGIGAMLDGTIWLNNQVIGVICHEHIGGPREWTLDEQNFVGSITDLARLTLEAHKRQEVEDSLSHQQKHLETIVQKRTASIENNAKLFRFLVERAPVTILYMNIANEIIEMNPEAERLSGYSREFSIGKSYNELFGTEQNKQQLYQINQQVAFGRKIQGEEITTRCADGGTLDLVVSRCMELDDDNNPVIISIGQDMSKQKALEANAKKLLESEKRYSYVVEHAPIPILIIDKLGNVVDANPEALSAAGYNREQMIGQSFIQLIVAKESRKKAIAAAGRAMNGQDFRAIELMLQNAAGEKYVYQCSMGAVAQSTSNEGQIVAIALDISRQKALQESLITAREAAESADRIKSMFVASMSHELRTPLNFIIGFLGVVLQGMSGELNFKQKDQLGRAYHSAKHLLSLISDVIDISKIEAGFLEVHIEKFELAPLLADVQHAVAHILEERHLEISINCPNHVKLETDRKRLFQVILNVVSNAVKYTPQGRVEIHASVDKSWLSIAVSDTGIGITEVDLAKLFQPFERIDSPLKIKTLGTGLGLYLTRKILSQLLSGRIEVQSELEKGSTFTIKLPIKITNIALEPSISILDEPATTRIKTEKSNLSLTNSGKALP